VRKNALWLGQQSGRFSFLDGLPEDEDDLALPSIEPRALTPEEAELAAKATAQQAMAIEDAMQKPEATEIESIVHRVEEGGEDEVIIQEVFQAPAESIIDESEKKESDKESEEDVESYPMCQRVVDPSEEESAESSRAEDLPPQPAEKPPELPRESELNTAEKSSDDDFGDFDEAPKVPTTERQVNEEDKQVPPTSSPVHEVAKALETSSDDDFGDFDEAQLSQQATIDQAQEGNEDDFGDFGSSQDNFGDFSCFSAQAQPPEVDIGQFQTLSGSIFGLKEEEKSSETSSEGSSLGKLPCPNRRLTSIVPF